MRFSTVFFDSGGTLYSGKSWGRAPSPEAAEAGQVLRLQGALEGLGYHASREQLQNALEATQAAVKTQQGRFYQHNHWVSAALTRLKLPVWPAEAVILTDAFLGPRYRDWLFPGTVEAIAELHRAGVYLGIIANTHWPGYTMHRHFEGVGLARYWDLQIYSCDVGIDKPDPAIFRLAEKRSGRNGVQSPILYVGNSVKHDIDGAHSVGWQAAFRREPGGAGCESAEFQFEQSSELVQIVLG